jgi:hypothetical protein
MCVFGNIKASVSLEVNAALKWLLVCSIAKCFSYIYTTLLPNEDVSWISTIFASITIALIYVHLHRAAVAKAKLAIEEGDGQWTWSVVVVTLSSAAFFGSILLARDHPRLFADDASSSSSSEYDASNGSSIYILVHILFIIALLFDLAAFVTLNQFQVSTNDQYL